MAVMRLKVPRPKWNDITIAAITLGLDMAPDQPIETGEATDVEVTGSWQKLQQALNRAGNGIQLVGVFKLRPNGMR